MLTVAAFVLALGVLIAVHEYGHYRVAVACGVKVLRFSVGFGKTLVRWQPKGSPTEFIIAAFPIGGYVKMLDEREGDVDASERHLAFNTQPLAARAAIVAAGPLINLLLAVVLYAVVNWSGVEQARAVLASPIPGSLAEKSGLAGGEIVSHGGFDGDALDDIQSFEDLRWMLARGALQSRDVRLVVAAQPGGKTREVLLKMDQVLSREVDAQLFRQVGIVGPLTRAVVGEVMPGGAAAAAGLLQGDQVLRFGQTPVVDGQQLRDLIRGSVRDGLPVASVWTVQRAATQLQLDVKPQVVQEGGQAPG